MISVLLTILKIIGLILGIIIGLFLLLILLVLFVPLRYRVLGEKRGDKIQASFHISYLLRIVSIRGSYENRKMDMSVRLFGKKIGLKGESGRKRSGRKRKTKGKSTDEEPKLEPVTVQSVESHFSDHHKEETYDETVGQSVKEALDTHTKKDFKEKEPADHFTSPKEEKDNSSVGKTKETQSKNKNKFNFPLIKKKIIGLWQKIKSFFQSLSKNIKRMLLLKDSIMAFFQDKQNKEAFRDLKKRSKKVLKKILPRKVRIQAHFGFDDPALTGRILSIAAFLYPLYKDRIQLNPDFQNKVLDGNFVIKGHIRAFPIVWQGIRLLLNKNVRTMIKKARNITTIEESKMTA